MLTIVSIGGSTEELLRGMEIYTFLKYLFSSCKIEHRIQAFKLFIK